MVTTRRIEKKKTLKHQKIRKCTVELTRLNVKNSTFRNALFRMYGIRDLRVQLNRVISKSVKPPTQKLKLLPTPNVKSVRSLVPWLPNTANLKNTSLANMKIKKTPILKRSAAEPDLALPLCHNRSAKNIMWSDTMNDHEASTSKLADLLPAEQQNSLSMVKEHTKPTAEDFHSELMEKFNSPNRSLQPANLRFLSDPVPKPLPEWKQIFNEFQRTIDDRKTRRKEEK